MTNHIHFKRVIGFVFLFIGMMLSFTSFPETAFAQSKNADYVPQNQLEFIAYLQGVVDTLKAQMGTVNTTPASTLVDTGSARVSSEIELHSTFEMGSNSYVYAWFQYGEGSNLDKSTSRTRINDNRDDEVKHSRTITNLKNNTLYSYRAVYETSRGVKHYGQVKTFQVGTVVTESIHAPTTGSSVSTSKGSLSTDFQTYTLRGGNDIQVSWTVTNSRGKGNWIGMYKVGDSNKNYQTWRYIDGTRGTESFSLTGKGTYEFRLFLNNSYTDVVTSRRVTIN